MKDICTKFSIPNSLLSPDTGQSSDGCISDFRISGHNSRTSKDIDTKFRLLSKPNKRNTTTSKKIDNDVMSANCNVIVSFWIITHLEQSGSCILEEWSVILKFSLIITFYLKKTENRTKKSPTQLSYYCFE